jgi:N-acetylmuramoyl-L-alanine amidase
MKLSIDSPNSQTGPLSGSVNVGGWAIDTQAAISKVAVAVDGTPLGNASYGSTRNDVCSAFAGSIGCPNVGWNYMLDTTLFTDGTHTLAVTGTTSAGQSSTFTGTFTVANGSTDPIKISIDIPSSSQTLAGVSPIGGWAVDTSGATITSVDVLIDGQAVGDAAYGSVRADVCAHYSNAGGCPNVGWNYQLDTDGFANGGHTLQIRATGSDGHQYTVSSGFNVANQP